MLMLVAASLFTVVTAQYSIMETYYSVIYLLYGGYVCYSFTFAGIFMQQFLLGYIPGSGIAELQVVSLCLQIH